jgi:GWxTD domain-containing protein
MRPRTLRIALFLLLAAASLFGAQKVSEKDLAQKYQDWLKLTRYIITENERDVFLRLGTDRERDLFMETFWKQRDPTPGTPQNEYQEEHLTRFNYANTTFRRGSGREGWMTDMGRIYIILGPPVSYDRMPTSSDVYPYEIWTYYGDVAKGLPSHFCLVFFQRGGAGEYRLYDPTSDGPTSLLVQGRKMDPFDYETAYRQLLDLEPSLAPVCLSIIPGDVGYYFRPSPQNAIIMASIFESPKKSINPAYATHFLNLRGVVSTEYLTNFVDSTADIALIRDPLTGINFLNFSVAPSNISIDKYEPKDQYFCNFTISVSLKKNRETIFQATKEFPFYFPAEDFEKVRSSGVSFEDSVPVLAGKYDLDVLLQNSVGKEFSILERVIEVPADSGGPQVNGPFLGYDFHPSDPGQYLPFKAGDKKLLVDPKSTFSQGDNVAVLFSLFNLTEDLWRAGWVNVVIQGLRENNPVRKSIIQELKSFPYKSAFSVDHLIAAKELAPDYYEIKLSLTDGQGQVVDEKTARFIVSEKTAISHPIARMKASSAQNSFLFYYLLAEQSEKLKDYETAKANYERALGLNKDYKKGIAEYARFLLKVQEFEKSLETIELAKDDERLRFDYFLVRGQAQMGLGRYEEAIASLLEGNKIYNSDTRLLNSLGLCYYRTNQNAKALEAFQASLGLNPKQEDVKKLAAEIEKK